MVIPFLAAIILGFLTGLGTGGGSLLILWLTLVMSLEPGEARAINLMFFFPSALISCLFRGKQGSLPLGKLWPSMITGAVTAGIFSCLPGQLSPRWLEILFGLLLVYTGLRELLYRQKE